MGEPDRPVNLRWGGYAPTASEAQAVHAVDRRIAVFYGSMPIGINPLPVVPHPAYRKSDGQRQIASPMPRSDPSISRSSSPGFAMLH